MKAFFKTGMMIFVAFMLACNHLKHKSDLQISSDLNVHAIDAETFVVTDKTFFESNVLVAHMPDGTVVIASSPFETVSTNALIHWINEKLKPKKMVAINTHFHADGTGGNEGFRDAGADIWANEITQKLQKEKAESIQKEIAREFADPQLKDRILQRKNVLANKTFTAQKGLQLKFGDEEINISYPGPAHSPDNIVVFLPKRSVLFGGCMIRASGSKSLGFVGHADIDHWEQSARSLLRFSPKTVVPGHGPIGGPELINETIKLAAKSRMK